jgi:meso-butanediol dehydrogenase / (S,S)-butanediol dehydrogenase / diacetyl reductase
MPVLENRIAIVTGAASGIGLACAKRFAQEGATVVGLDLNPSDSWAEIESLAPASRFHQLDVTDADAQQAAVAQVVENLGRIDVLVTAAGVGAGGPVNMLEEGAWDRVVDINLKGTFLSIKAVLDTMMAQRGGSIITIASVEGLNGTEGGSAYNASKGGVVLLTKNVAIDYGRMGIRCNTICPGFIDTPLLQQVLGPMPDFQADIERQIKLGRLGQPEEIAAAASFLASDDASYMTGQTLVVDGGYTSGHSHGIVELMGLI